jgi:hypothetical protein
LDQIGPLFIVPGKPGSGAAILLSGILMQQPIIASGINLLPEIKTVLIGIATVIYLNF